LSPVALCEIVGADAMSEFKFACPVCGQHITADSSTSGGQIECPTCFQKIVVPQAPESGTNKFILSASQVAKPRPTSDATASRLGPLHRSAHRSSLPATIGLLVLLCAAGAVAFHFRERIFKSFRAPAPAATNVLASQPVPPAPLNPTHPMPTNIAWTLELTDAVIPDTPVAGKIHGSGFAYDRAVLLGGLLLLGQGAAPPYDLGFGVNFVARHGEELSGKTVEIPPDQTNSPHVGWRWRDEQQQPVTQIVSNGYLLKVTFGKPSNGHISGKIYICLPDADKSFAAGTFDAEIRQPPPANPGLPKPPKPRH
jgi:DNA-directed RNA polymerase subunit RPC12/RpoP